MAMQFKWLEDRKQEWRDMEPKFRYLLVTVAVTGTAFILYQHFTRAPKADTAGAVAPGVVAPAAVLPPQPGQPVAAPQGFAGTVGILPTSNRNQGLEDLAAQVGSLQQQVVTLTKAVSDGKAGGAPDASKLTTTWTPASAPPASTPTPSDGSNNSPLGKDLPDAVNFDQPGNRPSSASGSIAGTAAADPAAFAAARPAEPPAPARPTLVVDKPAPSTASAGNPKPAPTFPIYSGIEAVMLSGFNARQGGSNGGPAGAVTKAIDVGAPFVSRVKGATIMPNSWKSSDLENCFIGGSATAVLSAERAYVISDKISCVFKNGEIYEGDIVAYGLDVDGNLGLAGKVVNKQGSMLMQAALTGMAAGLGSALAPTAVSSYNSNVSAGSTGAYTYPSPSFLLGTSVGTGVNKAATELSQFYLNFAKETFPVIEVTAGTRVTWILKQALTLKRKTPPKDQR
ncbi:type VI secretion protein [Burkholderia multivorans]|uniref:TraB/VirB10 family protein n=1 Tax=Burkholderia multivorans TaxID=87883 RepID=UPI001C2492EA|nr:TraB/VirB10 family protein [Burkholderia multivorans]MBU9371001.1 type VI secretion protein [Burkholderia multivorans]MBU9439452.1 type VI secretion protein [Burkholderia multivorans]MBU9681053.1 type VI secretion protein [Burkholderia multivorans]MCA8318096.1 type VI secretion protein [Burkholderia multivorans]MCA8487800.1 type VI secretion protein [Burkholderia multivorans]